MTITMCDGCGRRLSSWVLVETRIQASSDNVSIGDMITFKNRCFHFCKDCATARLLKEKEDDE